MVSLQGTLLGSHTPRLPNLSALGNSATNIHFLAGGDFGGIDFSKLGGGAGGAEEEEEEDDDDMPPLEGEEDEEDDDDDEEEAPKAAGKAPAAK